MYEQPTSNPKPLPEEIRKPLLSLRGRIHRYVMEYGLLVAGIFALTTFWLFGFLDFFPIRIGSNESPWLARLTMLCIWIAGVGFLFISRGLLKRFVSWPLESLALLIERRFPNLESSVSTVVQSYSRHEHFEDAEIMELNHSMLERTREMAIQRIAKIDIDEVLRWKPLYQLRLVLGVLVIASVVGSLANPAWVLHWGKRFFALSNDPWPRSVALRVEGIELDIPPFSGEVERKRYLRTFEDSSTSIVRGRGGSLRVSADRHAKRIPASCSVIYRMEDGASGRASLRRLVTPDEDWQSFVLEGPPLEVVDQDLRFSVLAEDLKLPGYTVLAKDGPVVTKMELQVEYPNYLQTTTQGNYLPETVEYRSGMRVPQGTKGVLKGKANADLEKVDFIIVRSGADTDAKPAVQQATIEGNSFTVSLDTMSEGTLVEFRLWNREGLCAERVQQYVIGILNDEVPRVDLVLEGIGTAITPVAMLPLRATIKDDHGTSKSWTELVMNESPPVIIPNQDGAQTKVNTTLDLKEMKDQGTLSPAVNSTIALTYSAQDHFDLQETPHIGRASPLQLAIVTPDALLVILENRERGMRRRLELIQTEMTQMRELVVKIGLKEEPTDETESNGPDHHQRMQQLRAQQSTMQVHKSEGELRGVEREILQITLELINNRIDSKDRRERLEDKVRKPILALIDGPLPKLIKQLSSLETDAVKNQIQEQAVTGAIETTDEVLLRLNEILENMVDILEFNEFVDQLRGMYEEELQIIEETKKAQKAGIRDLFK